MVVTAPAQSLAWMRKDALVRLLPFAAAYGIAVLAWHPAWAGFSWGNAGVQLAFGIGAAPLMGVVAATIQLRISRRRGWVALPTPSDALLQAAYFLVNAPLEEAVFRGLLQGGLAAVTGVGAAGFAVATSAYVLYHRLGAWDWRSVGATALAGIPLGLAFWLLPGPPSLLGVSISHAAATCGFLGPGAFLMRRLGPAAWVAR